MKGFHFRIKRTILRRSIKRASTSWSETSSSTSNERVRGCLGMACRHAFGTVSVLALTRPWPVWIWHGEGSFFLPFKDLGYSQCTLVIRLTMIGDEAAHL